MKNIKVTYTQNGIEYESTLTVKRDMTREEIWENENVFIEAVQKYNPGATDVELLVEVTKPEINKKLLLNEVGPEVASGWGAECTAVKCYKNKVVFYCIEHGERFTTTLTYDDIKEEYKYCLK